MNLEDLKKTYKRHAKEEEWAGSKVHLLKLSAQDHLDLFAQASSADKPATPEADKAETVAFHVNVVMRSLSDSEGTLVEDNEEIREWLKKEVDYDDLITLGELVLVNSGYKTEKKS